MSSSFLKPYPISRQDSLKNTAKVNGNYSRPPNMTTPYQRRYGNYYYENYGGGGGGGIEFRTQTDGEEPGGVTSPPLWKTSPCTSPPTETEETVPLHSSYNRPHYRLLSPTSRTQAIARGRQELMEMVKNMPESSYELSLKDLVDHSKVQGGYGQSTTGVDPLDTESYEDSSFTIPTEKKKKILRSGSINTNGPILLKMGFPISLGRKKKKGLSTGTCAKVSPRPEDRDWWRKRPSVATGEPENNGSSSGSSNSSSSSRKKGDMSPGCWSIFYTRKNKSTAQKGSLF